MRSLLTPSVLLMARLKYPGKFLVIATLGLFPLALTVYLLVSEINSSIAFARAELEGIETAEPIGQVLHYTPVRALGLIGFPGYLDREYSTHNTALEKALTRLVTIGAATKPGEDAERESEERGFSKRLIDIQKKWTELEDNWEKLDPGALSDRYGFLMDDLQSAAAASGEASNLVFEPDTAGNNLAQVLTHVLPANQPELFRMSVLASKLIQQDVRDPRNARIRLAAHGEALKLHLEQLNVALETAFTYSNETREALDTMRRRNHVNTIRLLNKTLEGIVFSGQPALTSPEYLNAVGKVSGTNFELYEAVSTALQKIVRARIAELEVRRNLILAIAGAAILLVLYLFLGFYRNVMDTVASLATVADRLISGQTDQPLALTGRDELNDIGLAFNRIGIALLDSKKETDRILRNANEGLFLIGQDFLIGAQYSAQLGEILERDDLAQKQLNHILSGRISAGVLEGLERFLRLMFQQRIEDSVLDDLNPLKHVEVNFTETVPPKTKYLNFVFNRIIEDESVQNLMVTVRDVTARVELEKQLAATEAKNKSTMEKLFRVIHIEPGILSNFLNDSSDELKFVRAAFRQEKSAAEFREDLPAVARRLHTIKGNAGLLELSFIADDIHELEDLIIRLKEKDGELSGVDILPLTMGVSGLEDQLEELVGLVERIRGFTDSSKNGDKNGAIANPTAGEMDGIRHGLEQLIATESGPRNKRIQLAIYGFDSMEPPADLVRLLKDVLVQLTRNSVAHGIETLDQRSAAGKTPTGLIEVSAKQDVESFEIIFRDDGAGLNLAGLREKARSSGQWSDKDIDDWSDSRVAQLIYASGLSTAADADNLAGRGVGMDVIRQRVREAGGKLGLRFAAGRFTEFIIQIPVEAVPVEENSQ